MRVKAMQKYTDLMIYWLEFTAIGNLQIISHNLQQIETLVLKRNSP